MYSINDRAMQNLDRWITGNYGMDQYRDDLPEDAYHAACEGEGCEACGNTGIDPLKAKEYEEQAKAESDAMYEAYLESEKYAKELEEM